MGKETDELFQKFDDISSEAEGLFKDGDAKAVEEFYYRKEVKDVMSKDLKNSDGQKWLKENLDRLVNFMRIVEGRTQEMKSDFDLFDNTACILDWYERSLREMLEDSNDVSKDSKLWPCVIEILRITLRSGNPVFLETFAWTYEEEYMKWPKMKKDLWVEFLTILLDVLPNVNLHIPKKAKRNERDEMWNNEMFSTFSRIVTCISKQKKIEPLLEAPLVAVFKYVINRLTEGLDTDQEDTVFHNIFMLTMGVICMRHIDICVYVMPELEKLSESEHMTDDMSSMSSAAMRQVIQQRSNHMDAKYIQRQIDSFLKDQVLDYSQVTPDLLLKSYPTEPDVIHKNMQAISAKVPSLPIHLSVNIVMMFKLVASDNPQVFTAEVLANVYPLLREEALSYFTLEIITKCAQCNPEIIDITTLLEFASSNAIYVYNVCQIVTIIGTQDSCTQDKAAQLIEWLIPECMNPANHSQRGVMLASAKAIGQKFKNQLMQYKPLIVTLNNDPSIKDVTTPILDYLENRSLAGVTQRVDDHDEELENVTNDLAETKETVQRVDDEVAKQGADINNLSNQVEEQKEEVKVMKAELAEAIIEIDRIDRKTVVVTPKWATHVSEKMNPEAAADWRLMSKRLGYTNDEVRGWASHDNPCLTMLSEWFATHISSEATRAVYIVLKEINREDAAVIVAEAMENAGELVPEDQPLDLKNPPSVFISYQWGVQDKAMVLKQYLTEAGFSCWLDIGQMGGGDKLYEKIDNGIRAAKVVCCLVTEKYAKSANCNKEVNLSVSLGKPLFPLLMEKMGWPPEGAMGPIFSEYLFVRFFQRETEKKEGIYWPEPKMDELLMQLRHYLEPDKTLVTKQMDNWWYKKTGKRILGTAKATKEDVEPPKVFISYQWGKQKEVTALYEKLTSLKYSCWLDIEQMGAGDSLFNKIDSGIRSCSVVISCVTQKYSLSLNCRREVSLATAIGKPIIPLLLEEMSWPPSGPMSMPLSQLQYIDYTKQSSLVSGDSFSLLQVILGQHGMLELTASGKKFAGLGTTMKAVSKMKRKGTKSESKKSESKKSETKNSESQSSESKTCTLL